MVLYWVPRLIQPKAEDHTMPHGCLRHSPINGDQTVRSIDTSPDLNWRLVTLITATLTQTNPGLVPRQPQKQFFQELLVFVSNPILGLIDSCISGILENYRGTNVWRCISGRSEGLGGIGLCLFLAFSVLGSTLDNWWVFLMHWDRSASWEPIALSWQWSDVNYRQCSYYATIPISLV